MKGTSRGARRGDNDGLLRDETSGEQFATVTAAREHYAVAG